MKVFPSVPFAVFFLLPFFTFGQNKVDLDFSDPYPVIDAQYKSYYDMGKKVVMVKEDDDVFHFQIFSKRTKKELVRNEDVELENRKSVHERTIAFGGDLYIFFSLWDKDNHMEQLFYRKLNLNSGRLMDPVRVSGINHKLDGTMITRFYFFREVVDKFDFFTNQDDTRLYIKFKFVPDESNDDENKNKFGFLVMDKDMKETRKSVFTMPYVEARMNMLDYYVDKDDNIYMLTQVGQKNRKGPDYRFEILSSKKGTDHLGKKKVDFDGVYPQTYWLTGSPKGAVWCVGYYSNEKESNYRDGLYTIKMDQRNDVEVSSYEFSMDLITKYKGPGEKEVFKEKYEDGKKDEVGLHYLSLNDVHFQEDGSLLLIGEESYSITTTYDGRTSTTYYRNDMLATKISPDQKLWNG